MSMQASGFESTRASGGATVVISSTSSDSHMWNLVYLQLLIEEMGHSVINLGACVPDALLVARCREAEPDLVVISSVNGHGRTDGMRVARLLRAYPELAATPLVIGGKLGTDGSRDPDHRRRLLAAGFDAVFDGGDITAFKAFVSKLASRVPS
jgi:methylaspartate mutase sigma subunit